MNKRELEQRIAEKALITKKQASEFLEAFQEVVAEGLERDGKVTISKFGVFNLKERKARTVVDPSNTEKRLHVPAYRQPTFKVSKNFRDIFN